MTQPVPTPVSVSVEDADVLALLTTHHQTMREASPEESCHVLDPAELLDANAEVFAVRENGELLGLAALVRIEPEHGELKSMHTAQAARGRGVGRVLLGHVLDAARAAGMTRVSLETGSAEMFSPARALYLSEGFELCPPFGGYRLDPLSVFMTRSLA